MPVVYSYNNNKGKQKEKNEDAVKVIKNKNSAPLGVICDGVSSHKNSIFSSNFVVNELIDSWKETMFDNINEIQQWLEFKIIELNSYLLKKSENNKVKLGTTVVVTIPFKDEVIVANIGDSLTYGLKTNNIELLSVDDSFSGVLFNAGVITEEEAKKHPKRHTLTQALGVTDNINIHIRKYKLRDFDYLISCSDGLTSMLEVEDIAEIVRNNDLSTAIIALINKCNELGGVDNISIIIFKMLRGVKK